MLDTPTTRRGFLRLVPALAAALALAPGRARALGPARPRALSPHPDPRPGIDASKVTPRAKLEDAKVAAIFDHVREMPQIADGIACRCGCESEDPSLRSLLSCYEGDGMAQHCAICQGQAETAYRMFKQGRSLDDIRKQLDEDFG